MKIKKRLFLSLFVAVLAIGIPTTANAAGWTFTGRTVAYVGGEVCELYEWRLFGIVWDSEWRCFNIAEIQ